MLKFIIHLSIIFSILQECSNSQLQEEQEIIEHEEKIKISDSKLLFTDQKDKLVQFEPNYERTKDPEIDALLKTV